MTAAAITTVVAQPNIFNVFDAVKSPMVDRFETTSIVPIRIGTATTPLITALQNSALIGLIGDQSMATPSAIATPITA